MENQAILKRLQEKQSNYNVIKWEEQRLQNEKLMEKISEYPMRLYDGYLEHGRLPTAETGFSIKENLPNIGRGSGSLTRKSVRRRNLNTQQNFYTNKQGLTGTINPPSTSTHKQNAGLQQDIGSIINLDADRKVLCKRARMMSNGYYLIEVSKTETTFYIAAIKKRNSNENYLIELEWQKCKEILAQFNIEGSDDDAEDDYDRLIDSLEILENRLVLLNPKVRQQKVIRKKRTTTRGSQSQPRMRQKKKGPESKAVESLNEDKETFLDTKNDQDDTIQIGNNDNHSNNESNDKNIKESSDMELKQTEEQNKKSDQVVEEEGKSHDLDNNMNKSKESDAERKEVTPESSLNHSQSSPKKPSKAQEVSTPNTLIYKIHSRLLKIHQNPFILTPSSSLNSPKSQSNLKLLKNSLNPLLLIAQCTLSFP